MLRKERMELLHRVLESEKSPCDSHPPSGATILPGFPGGGGRSADDVESELNRLDEAILDGKRELLRVALRLEEDSRGEEEGGRGRAN